MSTPLGEFLRARRDSTSPQSVGLPVGPRRRAVGLRRSELATAAGISVEYLTRIEQGRDRNPSPQIVRALADALDLDDSEREHIRTLTKITAGGCTAGAAPTARGRVRPSVLAMLRQFEPGLAYLTNRLGDVLAATDSFELLAAQTGLLDVERPNLTHFVFTDDRARALFPDWDRIADELAFDLWKEHDAAVIAALTARAGPTLADRMNGKVVPSRGVIRWSHPVAGSMRFDREVLELSAADGQQVVVYLAADTSTSDAVARLRTDSGPTLRVVT